MMVDRESFVLDSTLHSTVGVFVAKFETPSWVFWPETGTGELVMDWRPVFCRIMGKGRRAVLARERAAIEETVAQSQVGETVKRGEVGLNSLWRRQPIGIGNDSFSSSKNRK